MQARRLILFLSILTAGVSSLVAQAQTPSGLLADFRFAGFVHNSARATPGLEARTAKFAQDRFGNTNEALFTPPSGLVGSRTTDFLKNRTRWSWSAWVRPDKLATTDPGNFYSEGNNGLSGHISIYQGRILVQLWNHVANPNWNEVKTEPILTLGTWSHVAVTYDAQDGSNVGTCSVYHNGVLVQSGQIPYIRVTGTLASARQFAIGMNVGYFVGNQTFAPYAFDGAIDQMMIFDRALSAEEVASLMQVDDRLNVSPAIELHFQTSPGRNYRLQWSTDLTTWTDQGDLVTGTGAEYSVPVSIRSASPRYWRLDPTQ